MTAAATASGAAATAQSRADAAYTRADAAFTQASDGKTAVAAAITGKGVPASNSDTFPQLATKINNIPLAAGNAVAADVLVGKTFSTPAGTGIPGAMPDNGAVVLTPSALANVAVPNGRHNGSVVAQVAVNTAALLTGHSVAGAAGTMPNNGTPAIMPGVSNQGLPAGYIEGGVVYGDANLKAENIAEGVPLFGVVGTVARRTQVVGNTPNSAIVSGATWSYDVNVGFQPGFFICHLRIVSSGSVFMVTYSGGIDGFNTAGWHNVQTGVGTWGSPQGSMTSVGFNIRFTGLNNTNVGLQCYAQYLAIQ